MSLLVELFGEKGAKRFVKAMIVLFVVFVVTGIVGAVSPILFAYSPFWIIPSLVWVFWYLTEILNAKETK